jgi:hypothetical protein
MEIDDKLKKYIFKKLANDLSHVEIICYGDSVNFIDRDNNYWYMELKKNGHLIINVPAFSHLFSDFDNLGTVIRQHNYPKDDWKPVSPDSVGSHLMKFVCKN